MTAFPTKPSLALVRRAIAAAGHVTVAVENGRTLSISSIEVDGSRWITNNYLPDMRGRIAFSRRDAKLHITWAAMRILGDDDGATARARREARFAAALGRDDGAAVAAGRE